MILRANNGPARTIAIVFLAGITLPAQQAPKTTLQQNACDQAQTQAEMSQCAGEQSHKADARLNAIYRKILDSMQKDLSDAQNAKDTDQIKHSQEGIDKLKAAEKAWIQYRDLHCEAARHQYDGGSMSTMIRASCLEETTLHRIEELKSAYDDGERKLE